MGVVRTRALQSRIQDIGSFRSISAWNGEFSHLIPVQGNAETWRVARSGLAVLDEKRAVVRIVGELFKEMRFDWPWMQMRDAGAKMKSRLGAYSGFGVGSDDDRNAERLADGYDFNDSVKPVRRSLTLIAPTAPAAILLATSTRDWQVWSPRTAG